MFFDVEAGEYCLLADCDQFFLDIRLPGVDDAAFVTSCIGKVADRNKVNSFPFYGCHGCN